MKGITNIYYECVIHPRSKNKLSMIPNLNVLLQNSIEILNDELKSRKRKKIKGVNKDLYVQAASILSIVFENDSIVAIISSDGNLSPKQMLNRIKIKLWNIFREHSEITNTYTFWIRADDIKSISFSESTEIIDIQKTFEKHSKNN